MKSKMNVIRGIIIASSLSLALTSYGQISDVDIEKQTLKKDLCTQAKGPTGEHYISRDSGNNAQLWLERDSNKAISWLRFSYAL